MKTDELRDVLDRHAHDVPAASPADRVGSVRARITRARRKRTAGAALAATGVVAAFAIVPGVVDTPAPLPEPVGPPGRIELPALPFRLAGYRIPASQVVDGVRYRFRQSDESPDPVLRVELPASEQVRSLAFASDSTDLSATVSLRVDGVEVARSTAGGLESGHLVEPGPHVVVVRMSKPDPGSRLGLAVYAPAD
jgi:hypothetical protein